VLVPHATGDCGQSCGSSCSSSTGRHWPELRAKVYPGASVGLSNSVSSDVVNPLGVRCWLRGSLFGLCFQVKTFLRLTGGVAKTASTSFTSWRHRLGNEVIDFNCGGTVWWAVGGLIGAWTEKKIEAQFSFFFFVSTFFFLFLGLPWCEVYSLSTLLSCNLLPCI
jgi:hypothetical protein